MLESTTVPNRRPTGLPCSVGVLLDSLDPGEAVVLHSWLDSPEWSASAIHGTLRVEGYRVGLQTIGRHRRGECRCGR